MRLAAIVIAAVVAVSGVAVAADKECPPCAIKHCPPGTACRPPCDPAASKSAKTETKTVIKYVHDGAAAQHGHWAVPLTVGLLPSSKTTIAWDEHATRSARDPEIEVDHGHSYFGGAGLSYQWPSRWQLAAQAIYVDRGDTDARWTDKSHVATRPQVAVSEPRTNTSGGNWGAAITLSIPIGH